MIVLELTANSARKETCAEGKRGFGEGRGGKEKREEGDKVCARRGKGSHVALEQKPVSTVQAATAAIGGDWRCSCNTGFHMGNQTKQDIQQEYTVYTYVYMKPEEKD